MTRACDPVGACRICGAPLVRRSTYARGSYGPIRHVTDAAAVECGFIQDRSYR